jgi:hypothetical protein
MGILLEGFTLFILVGCLLTINGNHTQLYSVVMGLLCMFRTPFGHCVSSRAMFVGFFTWSWAYFVVLASTQLVMGWPLCQEVCFRVVGNTWGLHFHQHCYKLVRLLGKLRGLCLCAFLVLVTV